MNRADISRARQLVAELSAILDAVEGQLPKGPRKRVVPPPETPARPELVAQVRRGLRRRGVVA